MSPPADRSSLRVHFVITGLGTGGAESMLAKLVEHNPVLRAGTVTALKSGGELEARFRGLGVRVDSLGMKPGVPDPRAVLGLAARLRRERPDVVSTWMYHADLVGGLAARVAGVPVVWGVRSSGEARDSSGMATRAVMRACAGVSRFVPKLVVCCSQRARDTHQALGYPDAKLRVVPNGFDLARFRPDDEARASVRAELQVPPDAPLVGLIARFHACKNPEGFLRAAAEIGARQPEARFLMVGDGVDSGNASLATAAHDLGLAGRVHFLGLRSDVPRLMASLDVLASTSWIESFPNVLGEAMACGVPCVVTDAGDSGAIVGDTGTVVPTGDMAALAGGVCRILGLTDAGRSALGARARARVSARFEIGAVAREYESLLRQAAGGQA
jgi:glycosyltransferase involved in cell wall biosynthesis